MQVNCLFDGTPCVFEPAGRSSLSDRKVRGRVCVLMTDQSAPSSALILIDIQKAFEHPRWGRRNNPDAEANAARLLAAWREAGRLVAHVRHVSSHPASTFQPGSQAVDFKDAVLPEQGEPIFTKKVNSAFIGTDLESWLHANNVLSVVVAGLTTPHCVSTSVRMAANLGFTVTLVADATAAFDLPGPDGTIFPAVDVHRMSLVTLHNEFATIADTDSLLRG